MLTNGRVTIRFGVVCVITPSLPLDGGTARTAIQVHAVNLIEIRLGKRWQLIRTSHEYLIAPQPTSQTATGGYARVVFYDMLG